MTLPAWIESPRNYRWLQLCALLPFVVLAVIHWGVPPAATDGDYAHYILHAKALSEGKGYTDIGYIYTDLNLVGPRAQPPGWPLVLAPFVAVFGTHSQVFKLLVTMLVAAFAFTAGTYFAREGNKLAGLAVIAVVPIALETQYSTSSAMSDPLFCVLIWLTFLYADTDTRAGSRRWIMLAVLCAMAISVRIAGVAMLPALVLYALLQRKQEGLRGVMPLVLLVGAAGLVAYAASDYIPFLARTFRNLTADRLSMKVFIARYRVALSAGALYPFPNGFANDLYHAAVGIPLVIGAINFFRTRWRTLLGCFIIAYLAILVISPVREPRYAWPLFPLITVWTLGGVSWLGTRLLPPRLSASVPSFSLALVAVLTLTSTWELVRRAPRESLLGNPDTVALFNWMRATADTSNIRVVFTNPRVLTLETDIPAMGIPLSDEERVISELERQRITHVVVQVHPTRQAERDIKELVSKHPEQFPPVFSNASHDVRRFIAHPSASNNVPAQIRPQ